MLTNKPFPVMENEISGMSSMGQILFSFSFFQCLSQRSITCHCLFVIKKIYRMRHEAHAGQKKESTWPTSHQPHMNYHYLGGTLVCAWQYFFFPGK